MKILRLHFKTLRLLIFLTILFLPNLSPALTVTMAIPASTSSSYFYKFIVDENGFTQVTVDYSSSVTGYSWVFVPNFTDWNWEVSSGVLLHTNIVETARIIDENYYFYRVFNFSFKPLGSFEMRIQFNMSTGALIIEPRGIFFSPLIGFKEGSSASAEVFLPEGYKIRQPFSGYALAIGSSNYAPDSVSPSRDYARFDLRESEGIRLQIEFMTKSTTPEVITLTQGSFAFNAVKRYERYASDILGLFNRVYDNLVNLFNVTLENVDAQFFIPDFDAFLSLGGYVPFTGGKIGAIYINVAFTRYIKGVFEVIALHELVHHFLWETGISPDDLLWFHEGMTQYISVESITRWYPPGHEGALYEKDRLEESAAQINKSTGGNFNFLLQWKLGNDPLNIGSYYAAAYYVTSRLAETYGGLEYYARFFELIKGREVKDNDLLAYYLSLAANTSVAQTLQGWGVNVANLYTLTGEARGAINKLNPMFQPYKSIAEYLYQQALMKLEEGDGKRASQFLRAALFVANSAPLLTLLIMVVILIAAIYLSRGRKPKASPEYFYRIS